MGLRESQPRAGLRKGVGKERGVEERQSNVTHGITACCCSYDGSLLVYAKGYGWDLVEPRRECDE